MRGKRREEKGGEKGEEERRRKGKGGKTLVLCPSNHLTDVHLDLLFLLLNFHLQLLHIFTKFANL